MSDLRERAEAVLYTAFEAGWFDNKGDLGEAWSERKPELVEALAALIGETGEPVAWDGVYADGTPAPYGPFRDKAMAESWVGNTNPVSRARVVPLYAAPPSGEPGDGHTHKRKEIER